MEARTRRILFFIFLLIFLILTPSVLLYSQGYRFDWKRKILVKTGNLYLVSQPSGAFIFLDEKPYKISKLEEILFYKKILGLSRLRSTTPTLIDHLLPEKYLVTLKKENYFSWQKKVKIIPERTIIFRDILLFRQKPKIDFLSKVLSNSKISHYSGKIAFLSDSKKEIFIIDLENNKERKYEIKEEIKDFTWLSSGKKLIIYLGGLNNFFVLDLTDNSIINLKDFLKQKGQIKNPKIFSEGEIFFYNKESIYKFDLLNKKLETIYSLDSKEKKYSFLIDFIISNNSLFYLKGKKNNFYLEGFDLEIKKNFYQFEIPLTENYRFVNWQKPIKNFIFLQDKENLIILDKSETEIEKAIILKVRARNFDLLGQKLIYNNEHEISFFNLETKKKETLERTSEEILKVLWHPKGTHLFILFPKKIKILEIDSREKANYVEYNFEKVSDLIPTKIYNFIYFIGKIGEREGVFKIRIQ